MYTIRGTTRSIFQYKCANGSEYRENPDLGECTKPTQFAVQSILSRVHPKGVKIDPSFIVTIDLESN